MENEPMLFYIINVSSCKGSKLIQLALKSGLLNVCAEQPLIVGAERRSLSCVIFMTFGL